MLFIKCCLLILLFQKCSAAIYQLNDTDYVRMPPLTQLDDYVQCLSQVDGIYCLVGITLDAEPENELMHMIKEYSAHYSKHFNYSNINHGICVTKTCQNFIRKQRTEDSVDLKRALGGCLNELYQNKYGLNAQISAIHSCNRPNETVETDFGDRLFGAVLTAIVLINVVATIYDVLVQRRQMKEDVTGIQLILCFSIIQNWKRLVSSTSNPDPRFEAFQGMHGIRTISTFLTITAHVMWLISDGISDNPHDFERLYENAFYQLLFNGTVIVQIYFLMSGLLLVYTLNVNAEKMKNSWSLFPVILFYRMCRLTPNLAIVLGFIVTWFRHLGSGPLWGMTISPVVNDCRRNWWSHMLFVNNFVENNICSIETWHLAAELQMYTVGLIVYLATQNRFRGLCIFLMFLIGCVSPALHVWFYDLEGILLATPEFYRALQSRTFSKLYVLFYNNISCFAMGMVLGTFIYNAQKRKIHFIKYKILGVLMWLTLVFCALIFYSASVFFKDEQRASVMLRMAHAAFGRSLFGFIIAFMILGMVFRFEENFCNIIEWKGWRAPSRLTYGVFLVHFTIVHYMRATRTQLGHVSSFNYLMHHLSIVWLSFLVAVPIYLLVETPIVSFVKVLLFGDRLKPNETEKIK